jgi:hypothetical protein
MRVRILGRYWNLIRRNFIGKGIQGDCDIPATGQKEIRVAQKCKGQLGLEVTIHELLHAAEWNLDEEFVRDFSEDAARILWKLGYRPTSPNWP